MSAQNEIENKSFNRDFCEHLEWHLGQTFEKSHDEELRALWCDGILDPFIENSLSKKSINDTRKIITTAYIGYDGQRKYEMIIKFGQQSLSRYSKGLSMIDCIPGNESMDWITLDMKSKRIEIQLR